MHSMAANALTEPHTSIMSGEYVPKTAETITAANSPSACPAFSETVIEYLSYLPDCFAFAVIV